MSQFSHEHPEDWEEQLEAMMDAADTERKRRREEEPEGEKPCDQSGKA